MTTTTTAKKMMTGVIVFYIANTIFNIGLPAFAGITRFYYLGDYSTLFLLGFTTYAILRHGLFDIQVVATEVVTVTIWSVLLLEIFISAPRLEWIIDIVVFATMLVFGVLLVRSVVAEVEHRRQVEELAGKLKKTNELKNEFISVAAHELRAPLTAVRGFVSMILDGDAGEISGKTREFLQDSSISTSRMIRLVNNMLDVGRIEEGRIIYQEDNYKVGEIVSQTFNEFKLEAERNNLSYELEIASNIHDLVHTDRDRLQEVLVNFLSNALKYTDQGGIKVRVVNPNQNEVRVEVVDTGRGISKEEQAKLFRKFYRVRSNIGKTIGSGLGLYISKLLIEKFGGKIGVNSEPGQGSNFWFELPIVLNNDSVDKNTNGNSTTT